MRVCIKLTIKELTVNVKSPYGMPLYDFLINNCPCSVKLLLAIRSVNCKIEIVNSKENCFISFQTRRNKDTVIFLLLFSNSLCNVLLYVYYFFIVGAYMKIWQDVNKFFLFFCIQGCFKCRSRMLTLLQKVVCLAVLIFCETNYEVAFMMLLTWHVSPSSKFIVWGPRSTHFIKYSRVPAFCSWKILLEVPTFVPKLQDEFPLQASIKI